MIEFTIGNRLVGINHAPLVIAEIGINHNGSLQTAIEMVNAAALAGCEVVKFQCHVVEDEMSHHARNTIPGNADVSIYEIMESCALSEADERQLKAYFESKGMIFLSTPFSRAAADRLESLGVLAYKIGSGECNNYPLIEHIARFGKPIICSTGMNSIESIKRTVSIFEKYRVPYALLHCTNIYPTPPELVRLGALQEMQTHFPQTVLGLSDHTLNNAACLASVVLGACILERHFTDHKGRPGPDIVCSMTPDELKNLIEWSSQIAKMRGGRKEPLKEEDKTINFAFASVVTISDVSEGDVFSSDNIWVKRPGTGQILAGFYESVLGKRATRSIKKDEQLLWADVSSK